MNKPISSDEKMAASNMFDSILNLIQHSNLNFFLQISPFSAQISLKKSFAKNESGSSLYQHPSKDELLYGRSSESSLRIQTLEAELATLKIKYEKMLTKCTAADDTLTDMKMVLKDREETIKILEAANKSAVEVAQQLNSKLVEYKIKVDCEMSQVMKEYKTEVKVWKSELDKANENHINLLKKVDILHSLESVEANFGKNFVLDTSSTEPSETETNLSSTVLITYCSICTCQVQNYVPEYFCGEIVGAVCEKCKKNANLNDDEHMNDPFSSFPADEISSTLISHWISPYNIKANSLADFPSLKAHYVVLPNPGSRLLSMEEVMVEMQALMDKHRESCKIA